MGRVRCSWFALVFVLGVLPGCVDPLDIVGVGEVVTENEQSDPLRDDNLDDKHPEYDASRTVTEEFDGCSVELNKSASVTRMTLTSQGAGDEALRTRIFPSRKAALEALGDAPSLPTIEVVNGALKPFNDGLYAAVELAAERGDVASVNKVALLQDLLSELVARSTSAPAAERPFARSAAVHVAAALNLSGDDDPSAPVDITDEAMSSATSFRNAELYAKPIGFYTWTPELESIFTRDRWLQSRYVPATGGPPNFGTLGELSLLGRETPSLGDAYARELDLYAKLTDPFFDATPFDLAPFVPDTSAFDDIAGAEERFNASQPPEYPAYPFCNPGAAAFPASESAENRMMRKLLCGGELAEGQSLLDALVASIQSGALDLTPREDSGWYDQQLYALETLLVTDKASEAQHLLLTREYKQKLVETFKSLLVQTRETHVKQVGMADARATSYEEPPRDFSVYPKLVVEPFPTFYLRTARAYRFVEGVLGSALGTEFLAGTSRLIEDGTRGELSLADELHDKELLLYGLHTLAADSIGMAPELASDELEGFPLDVARARATTWLAGAWSDADVGRDMRVSLPVAVETDPSGLDYAIYWAVVGVKVLHLHASFPESRRPELVAAGVNCHFKSWLPFEPYLLVEQTIQARRPVDAPPLSREEFRALCDSYESADEIKTAFESAP